MWKLLVTGALLAGSQVDPATRGPQAVYKDERAGFTFRYPSVFKAQDTGSQAKKRDAGVPEETPSCQEVPLIAVRQVAEHQEELLMMLRIEFGCMGRLATASSLDRLAKNLLQRTLERIGPPTTLDPVAYKLDGHDAVFTQGSAPDVRDGIPGHAGAVCVLMTDDVLCWAALTAYPSHFTEIFSNQIQFGDHAPLPLVPASEVARPQGNDPR